MPGARLTHEDRRQIAIWLSNGHGYAEIARRLGRPTSTISREVARNSGTGKYFADNAQQATARRTHQRRGIRQAEPPSDGRPSKVVRDFVEQFAALLAATGLPRMASRVFTCLLTSSDGSLTAADLVRQLQVSPASVSKAIAYLEAMDLVARAPDPGGRRRERYLIDEDIWLRAWRADTGAHAEVAKAAHNGIEIFGADTPAGTRLDQMGRFFAWVSDEMNGGGLTETTVEDSLTIIAAVVYAQKPLTASDLTTALDLSRDRVSAALEAIEQQPRLADPLALQRTGRGKYTLVPRQDRLGPARREALR